MAVENPSPKNQEPENPETENPVPDDERDRSRANLVAVAFIALLFLGAWWVFNELQRHRGIENCIASSRRDCIPIVPTDSRTP